MNIDYSQAYILTLSVHFIGNTTNNIEPKFSDAPILLDSETSTRMRDYFLKGISKQVERYEFTHVEALEYNEVFNFVGQTLAGDLPFHEVSKSVAKNLYQKTTHPNIKAGEVFYVHFDNIIVDNTPVEAIGIFKSENKDSIFQVNQATTKFDIEFFEGINAGKLDKGCLVLDVDFETGFEILLVDNVAKAGEEAVYWKEEFLNVQPINNSFTQTKSLMNLTKDFIVHQVTKDVGTLEKPDQIDMLNKSVQYFKANDDFNQLSFEKEVFVQPEITESFRDYAAVNQRAYGLDLDQGVELSSAAIRKQAKDFKSILKLDKNFHIYIHGDRSKIERGTDENGQKFYKIFFDEEN